MNPHLLQVGGSSVTIYSAARLERYCSARGHFLPRTGRESKMTDKKPRHVALIRETTSGCRLRQAKSMANQTTRSLGALLQQPRMRRHAIRLFEAAQHLVFTKAGHGG